LIKVISVEREYGCGAANIAQTLADRLGWKLWHQEITSEIARRLKCKAELVQEREERCDSLYYRLVKAFMRGSFEPSVNSADMELLDAEHLAILFEKVVTKIAEGGDCGDCLPRARVSAMPNIFSNRWTGNERHSSASTTARCFPIARSTT
jgi:hypothetical protein